MSSSSSSSPSSSEAGNGSGARRGGDFEGPSTARGREVGNGSGAGRGGDFERPLTTRRRANNEIWPGPFIEDLVVQVAMDAARTLGRLAAAAALANVFQVCSTWRAVSLSDLLWRRLTSVIWGLTHRMHATWRDEYIYRHRTAQNFRIERNVHEILYFDPSEADIPDGLTCRCLALSNTHLACGFADGIVRLFDLATRSHVSPFLPHPRERCLGRFSRAVSGIVLNDCRVIFATLDGDINVAIIGGQIQARRAHEGNVVENGPLVDFTGCGRWWVALYAGSAGRALRIWNGETEELVYVNSTLTDPETLMGWHMLSDLTVSIGRVRVTSQDLAVACTSSRCMVLDLSNPEPPLFDEDQENRRDLITTSLDTNNEAFIMMDSRGRAIVRRAETLEELCRFNIQRRNVRFNTRLENVVLCMNSGYALTCMAGVIRVWDIERWHGQYLYRFTGNVGVVNAMAADDRHVAVASDTGIHLWDFGA